MSPPATKKTASAGSTGRKSSAAVVAAKKATSAAAAVAKKAAKQKQVDAKLAALQQEEDGDDTPESNEGRDYGLPGLEDDDDDDDDLGISEIFNDDDEDLSTQVNEATSDIEADVTVEAAPRTPKRRRDPRDEGRDGVATKHYKAVNGEFSPPTQRLLADSKKVLIEELIKNPFLEGESLVRQAPYKNAIRRTAISSQLKSKSHASAYARLEADDWMYGRAGLFVSYVHGLLLNQTAKRGRAELGALGLPGGQSQLAIQEHATWLLNTEAYKFGGLDVQARTFDAQAPYKSACFPSMLHTQFLSGRGKVDTLAFRYLIDHQSAPLEILALHSTALEHAIMEWSADGTKRDLDFGADKADRYWHHYESLLYLQEQSPAYAKNLMSSTFKKALSYSGKLFVKPATSTRVMAGVDYAALEAAAVGGQ